MFVASKFRQLLVASLSVTLLLGASPAGAQERKLPGNPATTWKLPPADATRAQWLEHFGLSVDPGFDPDPETVYIRFGKRYQIHKYDKKQANFQDQRPGWVRPYGWVNATREIYHQNDEFIWVFEPLPEPKQQQQPDATAPGEVTMSPKRLTMSKEKEADLKRYLSMMQPDFFELTPPPANVTLRFRDASHGLPTTGSWRNSLDVADMNGDGHADLIAPSQRGGGATVPTIFLGDGNGNWKEWETVSWPYGIPYGSVQAADMNKDGHLDLVFGMHLSGVAVFLGDGRGNFTDSGLDGVFGTRKALAKDIDNDGDLDVVAISEGPNIGSVRNQGKTSVDDSNLRAWLNDGTAKKWTETAIAPKDYQVGGDWMAIADFNGDKRLDFAGSSIYFNGPDVMYISNKSAKSSKDRQWSPFGRGWMPFYSIYSAVTSGHFTMKDREDVIFSYVRTWPKRLAVGLVEEPELDAVVGIERVSWTAAGPQRRSIVRWKGTKAVWGIASGDVNQDGHLDIVYSRVDPRAYEFLLGDGKGGFKRAAVEGIDVPTNIVYDIKLADVNADKRLDVILMYESDDNGKISYEKNGSVKVYLNEGARRD